uniref:Uncharacterized protein n=1 Tax=Ditylenchus dipsaci TaxID=166011 RepID=A0A915D1V1_9BILA
MVAQPDGIRRVKSSGDLMITSNVSSRGRQVRVTFDEHSIEFKERKKSRSLNDFYGKNRSNGEGDQDDEEEPRTSRSWAKKEQMEWFEKLKNSLESKSWLDYD